MNTLKWRWAKLGGGVLVGLLVIVGGALAASKLTQEQADVIINRAYNELLSRPPDAAGLKKFRQCILKGNWSEEQVRWEIKKSPEFKNQQKAQPPPSNIDDLINQAFQDVLGHKADAEDLKAYRLFFSEKGGSEKQLRAELQKRAGGKKKASQTARTQAADLMIKQAYNLLLNRDPEEAAFLKYRPLILQEGWTSKKIREDIKTTDEYLNASPDMIIKQVYSELLGRAPDNTGLTTYRKCMVEDGWSEERLRADIMQGDEYRNATPDLVVRRVYIDLLGRVPDAVGLKMWRQNMVQRRWTEEQLREEIMKSPEYNLGQQ